MLKIIRSSDDKKETRQLQREQNETKIWLGLLFIRVIKPSCVWKLFSQLFTENNHNPMYMDLIVGADLIKRLNTCEKLRVNFESHGTLTTWKPNLKTFIELQLT